MAANATDPTQNPLDPALTKKLIGQWRNELGSTLVITSVDDATGAITGTYRSPSGAGTTDFPLVGWVNTKPPPAGAKKDHVDVVSFSVRWGQIGSITAWNGFYLDAHQPPRIVGQWLLSRPNTDFPWDHILTGQDRFDKVK